MNIFCNSIVDSGTRHYDDRVFVSPPLQWRIKMATFCMLYKRWIKWMEHIPSCVWANVLCLVMVDEWEMSFQDILGSWKSKDARSIQVSALYNVQSHIMKIRMLTRLWIVAHALQKTFAIYMHVSFAFYFHFTLSLFILELISYLLNLYSLNNLSRFSRTFCI